MWGRPILMLCGGVAIGSAIAWLVHGLGPPAAVEQPPAPAALAEFEGVAAQLERAGPIEFFGARIVGRLTAQLRAPGLDIQRRAELSHRLSRIHLEYGEIEQAARVINRLFDDLRAVGAEATHQLWAARALVYLRQAEVENCINRHNASCCIFPLQGDGVHRDKLPARRARDYYLEALRLDPGNLGYRWLLNITYMAMGEHPAGVPAAWLIEPDSGGGAAGVGRFVDIAQQVGVDRFSRAGGAIVEDFDGDQRLDLMTSTIDPRGGMALFHNLGSAGFEERTAAAQIGGQLGALNCIPTDYDNDGDVDVLVLRGAWYMEHGRIRNSLLRNEGGGVFVDVTRAAGVAEPARPTQAAVWADFDLDGDLDLYVGNESRREFGEPRADFPSQYFVNNGDGTFTDDALSAGVTNDRMCKGVTAGDYDNDGDSDLYLSNIGRNRLYRNNGDGTFTDVAADLGVEEPAGRSFATWFFDYDNDGWLDLFVAAYEATIADVAADHMGRAFSAAAPRIYRNLGGTFSDVTAELGLEHAYLPMGANFGDIDNDGYLDIYLTTGAPDYTKLMPNVMLRNDAGRAFVDVTTATGLGHLQKGHGVAFADIDGDGDQDIYHQLGGFFLGDRFHDALFLNPGNDHHFLTLRLVGASTNRPAIGARIKVFVATSEGSRAIHRAVGSVSSFGGSPLRQDIGLGAATGIERLEITWPISGRRQIFDDVPLDARIRIEEDADYWVPLDVAPYDLGKVMSVPQTG